jgi:hypothetical protein
MDMEIVRQVEWTTGMRDMGCCSGWRQFLLLDLSFIGSLDGFDVRLGGMLFLRFLQRLGAVAPLLRKLYIVMGVCGILVFDE